MKRDVLISSTPNVYKGGDILISIEPKHCYTCREKFQEIVYIYKYKGFGTQGHKYSTQNKCANCGKFGWGKGTTNEAELATYYRHATIAEKILFV